MHMLWASLYAGLNFLAASVDVVQPQSGTRPVYPISPQFTKLDFFFFSAENTFALNCITFDKTKFKTVVRNLN